MPRVVHTPVTCQKTRRAGNPLDQSEVKAMTLRLSILAGFRPQKSVDRACGGRVLVGSQEAGMH